MRGLVEVGFGLVIALLWVGYCGEAQKADANAAEAERLRTDVALANARADRAEREADSVRVETIIQIDTARVTITRWRERTDTLTVTEVIALADTTIAACERALGGCEIALQAGRVALTARTEERDALADYTAHLEARLGESPPIWPTLVLVGGGAAVGGALDGSGGALVGAGIGLGVDVGRRGIVSLTASLRR